MKTADAIWMCLPEGMDELFEMVRFERTEQSYDIWLDEKKKLSDEDYRNPNIVARGYTDYVTIQDYPDARTACVSSHAQEQVVGQADQRNLQLQSRASQQR